MRLNVGNTKQEVEKHVLKCWCATRSGVKKVTATGSKVCIESSQSFVTFAALLILLHTFGCMLPHVHITI